MGNSQETTDPSTKPAVLTPLWKREVPQLQQGLPGTASLPHRLRPQGGPRVVAVVKSSGVFPRNNCLRVAQPPP